MFFCLIYFCYKPTSVRNICFSDEWQETLSSFNLTKSKDICILHCIEVLAKSFCSSSIYLGLLICVAMSSTKLYLSFFRPVLQLQCSTSSKSLYMYIPFNT